MSISYSYDLEKVNSKELERLTGDSIDIYKNSQHSAFAYDKDKLVGAIRALSDNKEWSIIYNPKILSSYDSNVISAGLIKSLLDVIKVVHIFGYSGSDNISLFEDLGFKRSKTAFVVDNNDKYSSLDEYYLPDGYKYENELVENKLNFPKGKKSLEHKDAVITYDNKNINIDIVRLNEVLGLAFNHEKDIKITEYTFNNSTKYAYAYDGNFLVGAARAISNGKEAIILNVAVDPSYQGHHIGLNLINVLKNQLDKEHIFLNTHPGGVGFYNRKGFKRCKTAYSYMVGSNQPEEVDRAFNLPKGYRFPDELK